MANIEGRSGIVLAILPATGDWRCRYCQVGWWWLSASPSGAGNHSRPAPRTPQSSGKQRPPTRRRRKPSTPTGAPSTASSVAIIATASGHEVGGRSFRGYPIVEKLPDEPQRPHAAVEPRHPGSAGRKERTPACKQTAQRITHRYRHRAHSWPFVHNVQLDRSCFLVAPLSPQMKIPGPDGPRAKSHHAISIGRFVVKDEMVTVTASDGCTTKGVIKDVAACSVRDASPRSSCFNCTGWANDR